MTGDKAKPKHKTRLPAHIHYSVLIWYFLSGVIAPLVLLMISNVIDTDIPRNLTMLTLVLIPPLTGFIIGWGLKFHYANQEVDETLILWIKAQFWGTMAFIIAFVISLLMIMMVLILLENNQMLPESLADPLTFIISMLILLMSLWSANNTKNRIHRNFAKHEGSS